MQVYGLLRLPLLELGQADGGVGTIARHHADRSGVLAVREVGHTTDDGTGALLFTASLLAILASHVSTTFVSAAVAASSCCGGPEGLADVEVVHIDDQLAQPALVHRLMGRPCFPC